MSKNTQPENDEKEVVEEGFLDDVITKVLDTVTTFDENEPKNK